jgi:predicted secreted protein
MEFDTFMEFVDDLRNENSFMKALNLFVFVISTTLLASCANLHNSTQTYTNFDSGKQVKLTVGQIFVVELLDHRTKGYEWNYRPDEPAIVEVVGKPKYNFGPNVDGSGGTELWTFRATKAGQQSLRLDFSRLWGNKEAVMETVVFNLTVAGVAAYKYVPPPP